MRSYFLDNTFIIGLGFEKCGTTSLNTLFTQHPNFQTPKNKETFFFNHHYDKGIDFYASFYDIDNPQKQQFGPQKFVVDITPSYIRRDENLKRIFEFNADKKFIVMLRSPLKQAFSLYVHDLINHHSKGQTTDSFARFLNLDFVRLFNKRHPYYFVSYFERVRKVFEIFGRKNVAVFLLEDMLGDFKKQLIKLADFLGDDSILSSDTFPHSNEAKAIPRFVDSNNSERNNFTLLQARSEGITEFTDMSEQQIINAFAIQGTFTYSLHESAAQKMLDTFYNEDIERLSDLLNRDLSDWKKQQTFNVQSVPIEDIVMLPARK